MEPELGMATVALDVDVALRLEERGTTFLRFDELLQEIGLDAADERSLGLAIPT